METGIDSITVWLLPTLSFSDYLRTYCHLFTLASGLHIIKNESLKKFFHKILDEIQN